MNAISNYDVAIVGAGPAGVASAISAASHGVRTLLIDSWNRLGGTVTAGMHRCLCGLYASQPLDPLDTLNDGPQRALVRHMLHLDPHNSRIRQLGQTWVLEFATPTWEKSLNHLCTESQIAVLLNTRVHSIHHNQKRIQAINVEGSATGPIEIGAVVDCTGNGTLLRMLGDAFIQPPTPHDTATLAGYAIRIADFDTDPELLRIQIPYVLAQAVADRTLPPHAAFTMFYPGPQPHQGICKLAINAISPSPFDIAAHVHRIIDQLRHSIDGFARAQVIEHSPRILPRTGHRLRGKHLLTESDILHPHSSTPAASRAWWPIEIWDSQKGPTFEYPPLGTHYDIPDSVLTSDTMENLFAAGACISATPKAAASARAAGICLATGAASGTLAANLFRGGSKSLVG